MKEKLFSLLGTLIFFGLTHQLSAQDVIESSIGEEFFNVETWITKPLTKDYKLSIFSLNTAERNLDLDQTNFMSYTIVSYDLFKGFGPTVGTRILKDRVVALGGPQYTYYSERFLFTANFTSEFKSSPDFEFFSILQGRPKLNEKLDGFLQGQFSFNFNSDQHLLSFQYLRIGADLGMIQTGLAFNQFQFGEDWDYDIQPGLFLRLEFK
ncbi:MAG: hypothetical protein KI790_18645 [Cyclobacteriaceae bacterium]|nr:hypothetical protein [Cyclobacteriaceae bacterium HetDA_MAG_MS6]